MALTKEIVTEIMSGYGWCTIDDLAAEVKRRKVLDDTWYAEAEAKALKADLRRILRSNGPDGWPDYASVTQQGENGEDIHVYKQEILFDVSDYKQVIRAHSNAAVQHANMAVGYQQRCKERFGVQIPLAFESFSAIVQ